MLTKQQLVITNVEIKDCFKENVLLLILFYLANALVVLLQVNREHLI